MGNAFWSFFKSCPVRHPKMFRLPLILYELTVKFGNQNSFNLNLMAGHYEHVDAYISSFPSETQILLHQMRETIRKVVPEAGETISYGIPTFTWKGNLVHYAGYPHHIGFYPGSAAIEAFQQEISRYKSAKGSVQFPLDQPLPLDLVVRITVFAQERNLRKAEQKKKKHG